MQLISMVKKLIFFNACLTLFLNLVSWPEMQGFRRFLTWCEQVYYSNDSFT